MTANEMPAVASSGQVVEGRRAADLHAFHPTSSRPGRQVDSPTVAHWRACVSLCQSEGDELGAQLARRQMLLAQAAEYVNRFEGER